MRVLEKGNTCHLVDDVFIHRNGTKIAVSCTSAPIITNKKIVGAVFNFHDITEQKRAENERRVVTETLLAISTTPALHELLSSVRDAINKAIYAENFYVALYDAAGNLAEIPFYADIHGGHAAMSQVMGKGMSEFVFNGRRPALLTKNVIERLVSENELKLSGAAPAVWVGIPLRSPAGAFGVMVLQHFEDETAYSDRDLDLLAAVGAYVAQAIEGRRIEKALLVASRRESAMIEHALDVICTIDGEGRFITINPACFRMWGYLPDELIGKPFINYVVPSDTSRTAAIDRDIKAGAETTDFENQYIHKDGSIVDVRWTSYWSETEQLIFAVAHDITERRQMELELERTRDAALEAARLKSEFLANMSHEIRTPMNGVVGMTELLLDTELSGQQREFTQTIASSADSLLYIIDEILDFSKIEAGQMRLETINFDLREVVETAAEAFAGRANAKGLEIASLVHSDVPVALRGDPGRMNQILTNLIGNAVKFTEKGNVFISVKRIAETSIDTTVSFTIRDTGIGISESSQQKLFQAFVQADGTTTRKYGGTGLGLAISKQLVELMGGEIELTSTLGEGSTFRFSVRCEKQKRTSAHAKRYQAASIGIEGQRVLIVDDDAIHREVLLHQVTSWGMVAEATSSAAEALRILRRSPRGFDIMIIDMMMPEINGLDLARSIKANPKISHLTLILLSAYGDAGHTDAALQIGIAKVLHKPVRQSQLYNCLLTIANIPATKASPEKSVIKPSRPIPTAGIAAKPAISSLRILVAEDNDINMEVARNQLRLLGYRADFVQNGQEAVDAVKGERYDVILMDCQMPVKDGFEATAEIRAFEGTDQHTTIVAVTAHAIAGDAEKCLAAGMDDYLGKPVRINGLRKLLEKWTPDICDQAEWPDELSIADDEMVLDHSVLESYEELQQPGEPNLIVKLIDLFMDRGSTSIQRLNKALALGDMAEVARQAHGIRGSSGNIGAGQLADISASLEISAGPADASILAAMLEKSFKRVGEILITIKEGHQKGESQK